MGEQISPELLALMILHWKRANQVFGKRQAQLLEIFTMARPLSKSATAAYRHLQHRLLRSVRKTVFVPFAPIVFPAAPAYYVLCDQIRFIIIFSEIMFMLFVLSSMFEF